MADYRLHPITWKNVIDYDYPMLNATLNNISVIRGSHFFGKHQIYQYQARKDNELDFTLIRLHVCIGHWHCIITL